MISPELVVDLLILMVSVAYVSINVVIVLRTEKLLDTAAKFFLAASVVLMLAAAMKIDKYLGIFSQDYADWIFYTSRLIALSLFYMGAHTIMRITYKESVIKNKNE